MPSSYGSTLDMNEHEDVLAARFTTRLRTVPDTVLGLLLFPWERFSTAHRARLPILQHALLLRRARYISHLYLYWGMG